jgi:rhamnosyltransferase
MNVLIFLASYNGEKYIKKQIESILLQENISVHVMVFDDASSDQTTKVVGQFLDDSRVSLFGNTVCSGSGANNFFNALNNTSEITINKYDFIAFSDQDDIWLPNKLSAARNMLLKENSSLYCSNLILWNEEKNKKSIIKKAYPQKKYDFLFEGGSAGCTYVFTNDFCCSLKNTLEKVAYTNWNLLSHDWFVYFFARLNNYKVSIDSNAYIIYRIHANNFYGYLNLITFSSIKTRFKLVKQGWYKEQVKNFCELLPNDSAEKHIYRLYSYNYFTRLYVIIWYNFNLIRSFKKFLLFLGIHFFIVFNKKSVIDNKL